MKIRALRNIISTNHGIIGAGQEKEIPDALGAAWVKAGAAEAIQAEKQTAPEKEQAEKPVKETATKAPRSEKAVK